MSPLVPRVPSLGLDAPRSAQHGLPVFRFVLLVFCLLFPASCAFPGSVPPTVKIGVSAPFEGLYRDRGYQVLHAVRLAVRQRNESGGVGGRYVVELVALNDFDEAEEAVSQAREMAVDPAVLGVLGGWSPGTARLAAPEYRRLGLACLAPEVEFVDAWSLPTGDAGWAESYRELSGGAVPGAVAAWAYGAANRLLDALDAASGAGEQPTRADVQAELAAGRP